MMMHFIALFPLVENAMDKNMHNFHLRSLKTKIRQLHHDLPSPVPCSWYDTVKGPFCPEFQQFVDQVNPQLASAVTLECPHEPAAGQCPEQASSNQQNSEIFCPAGQELNVEKTLADYNPQCDLVKRVHELILLVNNANQLDFTELVPLLLGFDESKAVATELLTLQEIPGFNLEDFRDGARAINPKFKMLEHGKMQVNVIAAVPTNGGPLQPVTKLIAVTDVNGLMIPGETQIVQVDKEGALQEKVSAGKR
jgi:hypothetical protein